jgi:3-oxoadipate enol-lactonase
MPALPVSSNANFLAASPIAIREADIGLSHHFEYLQTNQTTNMEPIAVKSSNLQINVNGITISFDDVGKGQVPIIFIHGFPFDKSSWQPQMAFFQDTHRAIAYDIRGFGTSGAGEEKASMYLFADDLVKFMDALEIDKAIVCGLSMGGYILMNAMQRYPQRFEAIILSDTQCIADSEEAKAKRQKTILDIKESGLSSFSEGFVNAIFSQTALENENKWVAEIKKIIISTPVEIITGTLSALAERSETCSSLAAIDIPTLILCGREDKVTPVAQSEQLHREIATSTLHIIDKAGHVSNLEQPDEFNAQILNFISQI